MANIYTIYSAFCIVTQKRYIGFDSNWPNRMKCHKREHKKQNNIKFYNAIRKYGWQNFIWEILYQSKDGEHCLNVMEPFFINEFNSFINGYNMTVGGNKGPVLNGSENPMWGKTHTINTRNKLSIVNKGRFLNKTYEEMYGKEKAFLLKQQKSLKLKGKINHNGNNNPRFDCTIYTFYNLKTGEIIDCNRSVFYSNYGVNKGGVSEMINKGIIYKDWCVIYQ